MTTKHLSPAAQAVKDAVLASYGNCKSYERSLFYDIDKPKIIAAVRALVDEVVPSVMCSTRTDRGLQRTLIRNKILEIAAELEETP